MSYSLGKEVLVTGIQAGHIVEGTIVEITTEQELSWFDASADSVTELYRVYVPEEKATFICSSDNLI